MPIVCALGQRQALRYVQFQCHADELALAFLDDIYVVTSRIALATSIASCPIIYSIAVATRPHTRKTRIWNSGGSILRTTMPFHHAAQLVDPVARIQFGDLRFLRQGAASAVLSDGGQRRARESSVAAQPHSTPIHKNSRQFASQHLTKSHTT